MIYKAGLHNAGWGMLLMVGLFQNIKNRRTPWFSGYDPRSTTNRVRAFNLFAIVIAFMALVMTASCSPKKKSDASSGSFSDTVRGMDKIPGFFDIYIDKAGGRIFAKLPKPDEDGISLRLIHANSLTAGLGSNPVGLDRGLTTNGRVLAFRKLGPTIIAELENTRYRASADNPQEKQSVANSFARSFLWSGPIRTTDRGGNVLIDLTDFLVADHMDIRGRLKQTGQGGYTLAEDRSIPALEAALAFPDNVELDAHLTFTNNSPGRQVSATAAAGNVFTLTLHHSFVRLPDDGYTPRKFDPRTAAIDVPFYDFSASLVEPIRQTYARRFRLERSDPASTTGPVKKPIVYYVDRGAPEPIRSALIDGASWWADAFEEAGFENAYRVEVLPEDAHPMDVRYNVIQWTHRQTRGWSYGGGISDPRTGEMIKAHVILGSQRVRQDRMIFEGLAGTSRTGSGNADDPIEISLARIRQLSAHEVGHTLGFAHNFAASTNNRASVMDYPAPDIRVHENGGLDFSQSYGVGVGSWDKFTVKWLYSQFAPDSDEDRTLNNMIERAYDQGLRFVSDRHARSVGTAHPYGALWDNGSNPIDALGEAMAVRRIALQNFDLPVIRTGEPRARLREVFVPVYLYHRYQINAVAKLIGGFDYAYSVSGDGLSFTAPVSPEQQRAAIAALLKTLAPDALSIPERILVRLSPPVGGFGASTGGSETFEGNLREVFDPLNAAEAAATAAFTAMLEPTRLARLIETNRRNPDSPGYEELLAALEIQLFAPETTPALKAIARRLQTRFVLSLMAINRGAETTPEVRAETDAFLSALQSTLSSGLSSGNTDPDNNHRAWLLSLISTHLNDPMAANAITETRVAIPPGSPIGSHIGSHINSASPDRLGYYDPTLSIHHTKSDCWHCDTTIQTTK